MLTTNYFNQKKYELEQFQSNLKKQIFIFESQPFKTKEKILNCQSLIKQSLVELDDYRNKIRGFNYYGFIMGVCIFHTLFIFKTKRLLYEMNVIEFKRHIILTFFSGIISGSVSGYITASDFRLYSEFRKTRKCVDDLYKNFEYYYILNKEQVFDD
jgi:hypothetical protein